MSACASLMTVLARALADHPDRVRVTEQEHAGTSLVEVYAAPGDVGKMIGRQGRTIAAMRTLAGVVASRQGTRVTVEVRDEPRDG